MRECVYFLKKAESSFRRSCPLGVSSAILALLVLLEGNRHTKSLAINFFSATCIVAGEAISRLTSKSPTLNEVPST